jgi:tetratricopeptide (TPR) repeat protein
MDIFWMHRTWIWRLRARGRCRRSSGGEADTLDSLGYAHSRMGDFQEAAECYSQAVEIYHEIGDRFHEAGSHIGLGDAQLHAGDPAAARKNWELALAILESIPHPDAGQARTRLNQLVRADESPAEPSAAPATGVPAPERLSRSRPPATLEARRHAARVRSPGEGRMAARDEGC